MALTVGVGDEIKGQAVPQGSNDLLLVCCLRLLFTSLSQFPALSCAGLSALVSSQNHKSKAGVERLEQAELSFELIERLLANSISIIRHI